MDVHVDAMGAGSAFRIFMADSYGNGGFVSSSSVTWGEANPPAVENMNPNKRIPFIAITGT
ncbi:MAG: hypothetical protein JO040_14900 [Gemmatimonadetes bacterium]|nr:hypothetical protein [Gemmatimonadota bacterium]